MNNETALVDTHNLRIECDSLSKLVKSSQEEVDQYNIPDPLELKELKGIILFQMASYSVEDFDLLMVANGWTLKQITIDHISFIFDSAVIIAFDQLQTGLWTASTQLVVCMILIILNASLERGQPGQGQLARTRCILY